MGSNSTWIAAGAPGIEPYHPWRGIVRVESQIRQAIEQGIQCSRHLETRQMLAQADVRPEGKSHMARRRSEDVKAVRVGESCWIAVG